MLNLPWKQHLLGFTASLLIRPNHAAWVKTGNNVEFYSWCTFKWVNLKSENSPCNWQLWFVISHRDLQDWGEKLKCCQCFSESTDPTKWAGLVTHCLISSRMWKRSFVSPRANLQHHTGAKVILSCWGEEQWIGGVRHRAKHKSTWKEKMGSSNMDLESEI